MDGEAGCCRPARRTAGWPWHPVSRLPGPLLGSKHTLCPKCLTIRGRLDRRTHITIALLYAILPLSESLTLVGTMSSTRWKPVEPAPPA